MATKCHHLHQCGLEFHHRRSHGAQAHSYHSLHISDQRRSQYAAAACHAHGMFRKRMTEAGVVAAQSQTGRQLAAESRDDSTHGPL